MTRRRLLVYGLRIGAVAILLGGWWFAVGPGGVSRLLVPSMSSVGSAVGSVLRTGGVWTALLYTLWEFALASAISSTAGVLVGFWVARSGLRRRILEPMLAWGYMTPFVLFYPVFILVLGIGASSKIAFAATAAFFPVAYIATRAFSNVSTTYVRMVKAFGANARQVDWFVKVRAGMPMVRSGLRIGIATCLILVILAEMLGSARGLGYLLAQASQTLAVPRAYALTVLLLVLAAAIQKLLDSALSREGDDMVNL